MLEWRLRGLSPLADHGEPTWARVNYPQDRLSRTSTTTPRRRAKAGPKSLDEVDPEILETYEKLGIPLREQEILAGVADGAPRSRSTRCSTSVSVVTTFKEELTKAGVIFCSISEAIREHPELVQQVSRHRRAGDRQLLRHAELGGLLRRLVRLRARRACAARWSSRPISASTRRTPASSSAR